MLRRWAPAAAAVLLVASFLVPRARATVLVRMSLEELARSSDAIVLGRVVRTEPRLARGLVVTDVTLAVDDWWAGADADGARRPLVTLRVHGGRIGGVASFVDGQARFLPGEDVVVFLFRGGGALWPQGMSQGKWLVGRGAGGPSATSQADASALVTRGAGGALVRVPDGEARQELPLAELRARVRAARPE